MRVVVAGSRSVRDIWIVDAAIHHSGFPISCIIEGEAPGVDMLARLWAEERHVSFDPHPADWANTERRPDAIMRRRRDGVWYDVRAGYHRNTIMAKKAEAAIIIWDWHSGGTKHMLKTCLDQDMPVFVYRTYEGI